MSKMPIDKLAEMTQEQFARIDERFDGVDGRLDGMDAKLDKLQTGQERIMEVLLEIPSKKAFERVQSRNEARFATIEKKIGL